MTAKEPKYCELCGENFFRVIGSKNKYCIKCHANWNKALKPTDIKTYEKSTGVLSSANFSYVK